MVYGHHLTGLQILAVMDNNRRLKMKKDNKKYLQGVLFALVIFIISVVVRTFFQGNILIGIVSAALLGSLIVIVVKRIPEK